MTKLDDFLRLTVERGGSDLHVKAGQPPVIRVHGDLLPTDLPKLTAAETDKMARTILPAKLEAELDEIGGADFAYNVTGLGRFRVNVFRQRGAVGMVLRRVAPAPPQIDSLHLPPIIKRLAEEPRGLVLVTGPTGSGKTTTCASMINHINSTRSCNIVSLEDPIEILHTDKKALVNQREIGTDTESFSAGLRHAMRQDPDVIFLGEMRDPETVWAALAASETGHFVLSTLHTVDAAETVNRVIDFFPSQQQKQIRHSLATALRGIVSQRLLPTKTRKGRVPAIEVLVSTGRVHDAIIDPDETRNIPDIVAEGEYYGMQTFDQALMKLYRNDEVTLDDALHAASNPHDFKVALKKAGVS
ncbi:MAG TPA: PilT/PilU family type 4a pilus ATPase [Actinomycetota bacterium]|nr:PilT/PilU family type 4a pilus ATPase [Actinomycetota bacterium]